MPVSPSSHRLLLITGMHRSGTSFIALLCNVFGLDLPPDLVPPDQWNKKGYFEASAVQDAQERLLSAFGRDWFDLRPFPVGWLEQIPSRVCMNEIRVFLEEAYQNTSNLVIKDPRSSLLIPLWQKIADENKLDLRILTVVRRPRQVARSLDLRDHMNPLIGMALWWQHTAGALESSKGRPHGIAIYEDILRRPQILFDILKNEVGMVDQIWSSDMHQRALACIDEDLQTYVQAPPTDSLPILTAECDKLYERLTKIKSVPEDFLVNTPEELQSILDWFPEWQRLFVKHLAAMKTLERLRRVSETIEAIGSDGTIVSGPGTQHQNDRVSHV